MILISGTLQIRYNLGGLKEPFVISLDHRNVANGQPHSVNISRRDRLVHLQVNLRLMLIQMIDGVLFPVFPVS